MNKLNERLLQKWERNPLQYRKEIERTERQYCRDHHHNLLEIPYTDFDRIGEILSDILIEGKTTYSTYHVF